MGKVQEQVEVAAVDVVYDKDVEIYTASDENMVIEDFIEGDTAAGVPDEDNGRAEIYKKYDEKRNADAGVVVPDDQVADEEIAIVVNGRERMILKSKIDDAGGVVAYQKNAAASEALNQAKEFERAAKARADAKEAQLLAFEQQLLAEQKNSKQQSAPDSAALKELANQYNEALISGEMEEASDLLLKIQGAQNATPVDVEAIAMQAVRRAKQELAQEHQQKEVALFKADQDIAVQKFLEEDTDISGDPVLSNMADAETIKLQSDHPDWSASKIIDEATKNVRKWVSTKFGAAPNKLSVKRSIDTVRGGSARAVPRQATKPLSSSDYISYLRKQRGLD